MRRGDPRSVVARTASSRRRPPERLKLLVDSAGAGKSGGPGILPTAPLRRHRQGSLALRKVKYVRRFFPELDDLVLKVGLTRSAAGFADLEGLTLWLNPSRLSLHTIAHELVHLLQARGLVPGGERSCDIYALARDASLVDSLPYYLRLPLELADESGWLRPGSGRLLHRLAAEALARRERGHRQYIRWFEEEAGRLVPKRKFARRRRPRPLRLL